jgi:hypothetical protein
LRTTRALNPGFSFACAGEITHCPCHVNCYSVGMSKMSCAKCGKPLLISYNTCTVCGEHFCDEHIQNHDHTHDVPPAGDPLAPKL